MKVYIAAVVVAVLLAACGGHAIYNVNARPVPPRAQSLPLERIQTLIVDAGRAKGWRFEQVAPGKLRGSHTEPRFGAVVEVTFDQRTYSINHVSTTGLREQDGTIHTRYNSWIRHLQKEIDGRLATSS